MLRQSSSSNARLSERTRLRGRRARLLPADSHIATPEPPPATSYVRRLEPLPTHCAVLKVPAERAGRDGRERLRRGLYSEGELLQLLRAQHRPADKSSPD